MNNFSYILVDWDGTVRKGFTLSRWLDYLTDNGIFAQKDNAQIKQLFSAFEGRQIGHDGLAKKSAELYATGLAGAHQTTVLDAARAFVASDKEFIFPESLELLKYFYNHGLEIIIVSGAPSEILQFYHTLLPFSAVHGLSLSVDEDVYTGAIIQNPGTAADKRQVVAQIKKLRSSWPIVAMGNSESDAPLFSSAGIKIIVDNPKIQQNGVCFHLTPGSSNISELIDKLNHELGAK